jgi:hypothetical protein
MRYSIRQDDIDASGRAVTDVLPPAWLNRAMRNLRPAEIVAVAVLGIAACSSSAAAPKANPVTTSAASRDAATATTTGRGRLLHWTNVGPPLTLLAPFCSGGHCVYPFTETGTFHGDLEGKHVSAGVTALDATGKRYAVSRTDLFIGTVKGCGTGSMVFIGDENANATGGTGHGAIAAGFGTGDLRNAHGTGVGAGTASSSGIHSKYSGNITC